MKKHILLLSFLLFTILNYSQDEKISLEVNYPLTFSDDYSENYKGIIDFGAKYRFLTFGDFNFGLSINYTITKWENKNNNFGVSGESIDFKIVDNILQPRIFAEVKIKSIEKLKPSLSLGYSLSAKKTTGNVEVNPENDDGFNINLGLSYDISRRFYIQGSYNYITYAKRKLLVNGATFQTFKIRNNFLNFGFGYRL